MKRNTKTLGGVDRNTVMLAAGFCRGLAEADRFNFNEIDRRILKAAGKALLAAGKKLYRD